MKGVLGLSYEQFENLSLILGIGSLVLYMIFIMYRLARDSQAGRYGSLIIFISLGLGLIGLLGKFIIQLAIDV